MQRYIITFQNLHQVLSAEKALKGGTSKKFRIRPTPTPPGLVSAICGMSIEVLEPEQVDAVVSFLKDSRIPPAGVFTI